MLVNRNSGHAGTTAHEAPPPPPPPGLPPAAAQKAPSHVSSPRNCHIVQRTAPDVRVEMERQRTSTTELSKRSPRQGSRTAGLFRGCYHVRHRLRCIHPLPAPRHLAPEVQAWPPPRVMTAQATMWSSCSSTPPPSRLRGAMTRLWPTGSRTPSGTLPCRGSATS